MIPKVVAIARVVSRNNMLKLPVALSSSIFRGFSIRAESTENSGLQEPDSVNESDFQKKLIAESRKKIRSEHKAEHDQFKEERDIRKADLEEFKEGREVRKAVLEESKEGREVRKAVIEESKEGREVRKAALEESKEGREVRKAVLEEFKEGREVRKAELEESREGRENNKFVLEKERDKREKLALIIGRQGIFGFLALFGVILTAIKVWDEHRKNIRTNFGLLYTTKAGFRIDFDKLLEMVEVDFADHRGYTALHYGAQRGDTEVVAGLLSRGAQCWVLDQNNETPLYKAVFNNYPEIVDQLVSTASIEKVEKMVNEPNKQGNTPLMAAAYTGNYVLFEKLLSLGAKIEAKNNQNQTVLHFAISYRRERIAKKLVEGVFYDGEPSLYPHLKKPNLRFPLLLKNITYLNWLNAIDNKGYSPLWSAIEQNMPKLVEILIANGADINHREKRWGRPLLTQAICNGQNQIFSMLLARPQILLELRDIDNRTTFDCILSITNGKSKEEFPNYFEMKEKLYERLEPIRIKRKTEAFFAAKSTDATLQAITDYIQCGGKFEDTDDSGKSLLDYFIESGHLTRLDNFNNNILHLAARFNDAAQIEKLLNSISESQRVTLINQYSNSHITPVFEAAFFGCDKALRLLVQYGANLDVQNEHGWSPLSWAVWGGHLEVIKVIVDLYKERMHDSETEDQRKIKLRNFINHCTKEGETALWWALCVIDSLPQDHRKGSECGQYYQELRKIIYFLIENGADINIPSSDGTTSLHIMAQFGLTDIAREVLRKHPVLIESAGGEYQERALHYAAIFDNLDMVRLLIAHGADINAANIGGRTAYDLATDQEIKNLLVAKGYKNKYLGKKSVEKDAHVFHEGAKRLTDAEKTIINDKIISINPYQEKLEAQLFDSARDGDYINIRRYHSQGAKMSKYDSSIYSCGWSALHWAAYLGHYEVVKELLDCYPDKVSERTAPAWFYGYLGLKGKQTPLMLVLQGNASTSDKEKLVKLFIERDARGLKIQDQHGRSVTDYASSVHPIIRNIIDPEVYDLKT